MIELRWLERKEPCNWENYNHTGYITVRALQYRVFLSEFFVHPMQNVKAGWQEWIDVPMVKE